MKKYLLFTLSLFILPLVSFAQAKYEPLVNIPGLSDGGAGGFSTYINFLYAASISIAALLAVIKIIVAGVKYMMTDVVSTKSNAKGEIQGALLGLLLILGAYIILYIINPRLVNPTVNFEQIPTAPAQTTPSVITTPGGTPTTPPGTPQVIPLRQRCASAGGSLSANRGTGTSCEVTNTTAQKCDTWGGTVTSTGRTGVTCKIVDAPAPTTPTVPKTAFEQRCDSIGGGFLSGQCLVRNITTDKCTSLGGVITAAGRGGSVCTIVK